MRTKGTDASRSQRWQTSAGADWPHTHHPWLQIGRTLAGRGRWFLYSCRPEHAPVRRRDWFTRNLPVRARARLAFEGVAHLNLARGSEDCIGLASLVMPTAQRVRRLDGKID